MNMIDALILMGPPGSGSRFQTSDSKSARDNRATGEMRIAFE
jgi:hypothetical protein